MGGGIDIEGILKEMTLEEKIALLAGRNFWETVGIERLGIPSLKMSDGPNGARGGTFREGATAACFPASVLLAASWNTDLALEVGGALAEETKTKGASALLAPTVCPHRSPLGGRNFESFSEDPFLAGKLAAKYITGLQNKGVGATIKHFAANEQETRRFTMNVNVSERALREIYLKPFEIAIKEANPWAVMTSYNLLNGVHADMSEYLIKKVLRGQWGWEGLVMSDWGGTNSTAESIIAGLDLEMPGPANRRDVSTVSSLVKSGKIEESTITERARNILDFLSITSKFANPETPDETAVDKPEHRQLIRKVGGEGIVLLKNEGNLLPLGKEELKGKKVAVLGLAKESLIHGGGSAAVNAHYKITPWEGLKAALGPDVEMEFAQGAQTYRVLPDMQTDVLDDSNNPGFTLSKYSTRDVTSKISSTQNLPSAIFAPILQEDSPLAVVATGTYSPKISGEHYLSFSSLGPSKVYINTELIHTESQNSTDPMAFLLGGVAEQTIRYNFLSTEKYTIRIESYAPIFSDDENDGAVIFLKDLLGFHLGFMTAQEYERDVLAPAVEAAKNADVALVFVGHTTSWETEGQDQASMNLPANGSQDALIAAVTAVNPKTIVINSTGVAIAMPWLESVPALIQAWFPGQEAGNAISDVLFGNVNPSGRLPVTFPSAIEHTPSYGNFPGSVETLQVHYEEGVFMGYRHYDRLILKEPKAVNFPFGFGLSYTTFSISNLSISTSLDNLKSDVLAAPVLSVEVDVVNTGSVAGKHVIQVYISDLKHRHQIKKGDSVVEVEVPIKVLAGFAKVELGVGEMKKVSVDVGRDSLAFFDEESEEWVVGKGEYEVLVGNSVVDIAVRERFDVENEARWGA